MILATVIGSVLYLVLVVGFLMYFTMTIRKHEKSEEYVSIKDLLNDKE